MAVGGREEKFHFRIAFFWFPASPTRHYRRIRLGSNDVLRVGATLDITLGAKRNAIGAVDHFAPFFSIELRIAF